MEQKEYLINWARAAFIVGKNGGTFEAFLEATEHPIVSEAVPAPIPNKELDVLANESVMLLAQGLVDQASYDRCVRSYKVGFAEALKSHPFNDEDMRNAFRHTSYMSKDGINLLDFDKWLEQYKASKTVI